jgi:hypothetical protein
MLQPPSLPSVRTDAIPTLLRQAPQWVLWRRARVLAADGQPCWVAAPVNVATGSLARLHDPDTWAAFVDAADALPNSRCDGLGFVLYRPPRTPPGQPGFVVLDLHGCRDPRTGRLDAWARDVVEAVGSYAELSPDGTGLCVWLLGGLPPCGRRKGLYENYQTGRFVTVTGRHLPGTPAMVEYRQEALTRVHGWFFATGAGLGKRVRLGDWERTETTRFTVAPAEVADSPRRPAHEGPWGNCDPVPLPFGVIDARLQRRLGPWPRRAGARLFAPGADGAPLWLRGPDDLFAWIARRLGEVGAAAPQWCDGAGYPTRAEYFRHLQQFAAPCAAAWPEPTSAPAPPPRPRRPGRSANRSCSG